jgi:RNA polymerase sigma-70 factor, ECF subfamily
LDLATTPILCGMLEMDEDASQEPPIGEHDESALVDGLRAFENPAWTELYDRHHTQLWRYAFVRTGNRDLADDIAAHAFSEAASSIHRYHDRGRPILAWLYAIARNLVSKQARRSSREVLVTNAEPSGGAPEERLDALVLAEALQRLTSDQREVVALRFYAGYSTREIAAAMRKREAAVYSLEVRAIAALRRQFDKDGRGFPVEADENSPSPGIDRVR